MTVLYEQIQNNFSSFWGYINFQLIMHNKYLKAAHKEPVQVQNN